MKRSALLAAVVAFCLAMPGCAALRNLFQSAFQRPDLRFKTLALKEVTLAGADLDTVWQVDNPNPVGLTLAEANYAFFVEGNQFVAGRPRKGLQIPAADAAEIVFPAEVKFTDLAQSLAVFLQKDVASYRAEGSLGLDTPVGILRFPLKKEGTFEVPKIPALSFEAPRVKRIDLSGAQLEIPLTLTNRNSYPLPFGGLSGVMSIGGARVGQVSAGELGVIAPRGTQTVTLPLNVSFGGALQAANAIRQGKGTVALDGQLRSGAASVPIRLSEVENFLK